MVHEEKSFVFVEAAIAAIATENALAAVAPVNVGSSKHELVAEPRSLDAACPP